MKKSTGDIDPLKPRNHIALALMKRGGAGSHKKSHKQLRGKWKREELACS